MISHKLDSLAPADLAPYFSGRAPVVIAGSGISAWEPTILPTGQDFAAGVRDALFSTPGHLPIAPADMSLLQRFFEDLPFEMIMERCPDQAVIRQLLSQLYSRDEVNDIHQALGDLARAGRIHSIITTNYDMGLDRSLSGSSLHKVVNQSDVPSTGARVYFKIHGSADEPGTMVFSLRQESELPTWKRALLSDTLWDRPLLLIGCSGLDFEVCPELPRCKPTAILWNFYSESGRDRSPGLKHVRRLRVPMVILLGDMCKLFSLFGVPVSPRRATGAVHSVVNELRDRFENETLLIWRIRVLSTIGYARLALESMQSLAPQFSTDPFVVLEYAQALFHNGQYKLSADEFLRAMNVSTDNRFRLLRQLDACDALRCFGDFRRAWETVRGVISALNRLPSMEEDIWVRAILKEVLLTLNQFQRRKKLFFSIGCRRLRDLARNLIQDGAPRALQAGLWMEFQQLRLLADRFSLPSGTLTVKGGYEPLPTKDGYKHLGYYIPLLTHLHDSLADRSKSVNEYEVEYGFNNASKMGCHPVAWKLARAAMKRLPEEISKWRTRYRRHFRACQYTGSQRFVYSFAWPI